MIEMLEWYNILFFLCLGIFVIKLFISLIFGDMDVDFDFDGDIDFDISSVFSFINPFFKSLSFKNWKNIL